MLLTLIRTRLAPYRSALALVVLLQFIGTVAALYLPSLNAKIIDRGVTQGDTDYILRTGGWMLVIRRRSMCRPGWRMSSSIRQRPRPISC